MLLMYLNILPQCHSVLGAQLFQLPHDTVSYIWNTLKKSLDESTLNLHLYQVVYEGMKNLE